VRACLFGGRLKSGKNRRPSNSARQKTHQAPSLPPRSWFAILARMEWGTTGRPTKRPGIIEPCIPTRVSKPPVGPQWIHEIKHDGYRLIARKREGRVRLFTRRGFDWTERYPRISAAVATLRAASATIDGEAVCCDAAGIAVFESCIAVPMTGRRSSTPSICWSSTGRTGDRERSRSARPGSKSCSPRRRPGSGIPSIWRRWRDHLCACLQARGRGYRLEAPRASLSIGAEQGMAQDQESRGARRAAI
jgi:hypothetical protein